jgi:hypothetical protein
MPLPGMVYQRLGPPLATMQMPEGMAGMTKISCQVGDLQVLEKCIRHTFVPDEGFDPIGIEINGRKGRRTCAVLGEDYRKLKVFDLDYTEDEARESSQAEALLNTERMADHIMTG